MDKLLDLFCVLHPINPNVRILGHMTLSEDLLLRSVVLVLRQHPGEWLSFKRLSSLLAIPGYDQNFWAGIVEYRMDLFVINADKRLKLRSSVVEEIATRGIQNWQIPSRPEPQVTGSLRGPKVRSHPNVPSKGGCYCDFEQSEILEDLKVGSIPDEALVNACCWRTICRVRGFNLALVDYETWREICQRRGYVQQRENPRGF